ncbi:hypothetical protein SRHO_G00054590 [Serrasalmus rhombeus]
MEFVSFRRPVALRVAYFAKFSLQAVGILSGLRRGYYCSVWPGRAHFSGIDKRTLPFNGFCSSNIEENISPRPRRLVEMCHSDKNILLPLENSPVLGDIFIKNKRVRSAKSIRHYVQVPHKLTQFGEKRKKKKKQQAVVGEAAHKPLQHSQRWTLITPALFTPASPPVPGYALHSDIPSRNFILSAPGPSCDPFHGFISSHLLKEALMAWSAIRTLDSLPVVLVT